MTGESQRLLPKQVALTTGRATSGQTSPKECGLLLCGEKIYREMISDPHRPLSSVNALLL
jgi:hypothetical protein